MTAPTLEAERAALAAFPLSDSPHTSVKMRADADRAAYKAGYLAACRTAAPVAEGVALPPLPEPDHSLDGGTLDFYTAEQVRQAQREAVEADRARQVHTKAREGA